MKDREIVQDSSELTTSLAMMQNEDDCVTEEKVSPTSPAVSRYGRTHKPKISDDFLPTDKKVGAILGLSPKGRSPLPREASRTSFTSPNKAVEKGRLVYELFSEEKKTSTRGRKPKLKLRTSLQSNKKNGPIDNEQHNLKTLIEIKSEVSTSEKGKDSHQLKIKLEIEEAVDDGTDRKTVNKTENEIMSPDVTSSVDDSVLSESLLSQTPLHNSNDGNCGWVPGDLAWARVGGHPFWPCMIAIDPRTGVYTKVKRVGRGLTSVQRSLHVQFFGDNGRHSWVSTNCVIKFEGKDGLQSFADKVLSEIKKKDKKFSSAFVIRPSSKVQWDCAVQEAEEALSKTNQERIRFFEENFPPEMWMDEPIKKEVLSIDGEGGSKLTQSFKRKRNGDDLDEKPVKQVKVDLDKSEIKIKEEKKNVNLDNVSMQRKRKPKKHHTKEPHGYRMFAEKYSKHASEIHPGLSDESLQKLMVRMWAAMDESEKAVYNNDRCYSSEESSLEEDTTYKDSTNDIDRENDNDNDNSTGDSTRESTPSLTFASAPLKKISGLFRGTRIEKVCQICLKPGNTVKCKGSCLGTFHVDCVKNFDVKQIKQESNETEVKGKRGKPRILKSDCGISSESEDGNTNDSKNASIEECKDQNMKNYEENEKEASDKEENKHSSSEECESGEFRCKDCAENRTPVCFECGLEKDLKTNSDVRIRCANGHCGKFYHLECMKAWPQASSIGSSKKPINGNKNASAVDSSKNQWTCPQHVCHTCASDDPRNATMRFNHERLVRCIQCPTAYHTGNYCIPAGSEILTGSQIICPRHYEPPIRGIHHVNAAWCFICAMGGSLICCDLCPTSFHAECLKIAPPEGGYICEDCDTGRYPLYGEVVWVKLGSYRWWPAQILFPNQIPDNIANLPHRRGEFAVRFFGSHDHYWVNRGRVFLYQEGDTGHKSAKKTSVDGLFQKALTEAAEAHKKIRVDRSLREAEARPGMKPPSYVRIKTNKPVGNVRVFEAVHMAPCECDPESKNPCGVDSDCLNRILMVECTPGVCVAGDRCGNQRFLKREYPPLEPFRTESRGWGLRALKSLQKGEFVIEYVGEMIDEAEYKRRLDCKHEEKDENYYFLTIDNHRLLDAGPKGNVARFMNHSCQPNCETQKWTVNGDTRVGLFALRDIPLGEELTFNYNLECVGPDKKPCMCGAPNCSGYIGVKVSKLVEDDKKTKLGKQENQKSVKRKKKRQLTKLTETECFECGGGGELLLCDNKTCPKGYHLNCAKRKTWPKGKWLCPWHYCDVCQRRTGKRCGFCPRSFCLHHATGNIRLNNSLGMVCQKHDENTEKQQSEAYSAILEDVAICLKGISNSGNNDQSATLVTKSDGVFDKQENTDTHMDSGSNLNHSGSPIESEKATENAVVSSDPSKSVIPPQTSVTAHNGSSSLPINNGVIVKRKRGRPRKYPLSPPSMAQYVTVNSSTSKETKTPVFSPELEGDATVKKKGGRKRKNPLPEISVTTPILKSLPVAELVTKDKQEEDKTPENVINLHNESFNEMNSSSGSDVVTPRTSGRKRHPSEKLVALMNSQSKSAKKLCKTLDNFVIKLEKNHQTDSDKNEGGKAHKISSSDLSKKLSNLNDDSTHHKDSIINDKKTVTRPNKTVSSKFDKNHLSKSYKNSVMKSVKIFSRKLEKHNSVKSKKVQVTKPVKSSVKKLDKCYTSKTENNQTINLHKHVNNLDKKNASKTNKNFITSKVDEGDKPIFKSYQKKTPKKTILQRVDHKPEVSKFSVDNNQKLLTGNLTGSVFLSSRNSLTAVPTTSKISISSIVNNAESSSIYQKGEAEMNDMSANSSILGSFDDNDSQYFNENVTTIPIKFSEFDQLKDEFVLGSNPLSKELVETHTNLDSEFISCGKEETTEKLSEDGKYQILTNMRPDSLEIEKQTSVLMGVES